MARRKNKDGGYEWHSHGCVQCKDPYQDACNSPDTNDKCADCQTGKPVRWVLLLLSKLPHACCFDYSRLARKDEVERQRLSKGCQWFRCTECGRTFPFKNPRAIPVDSRTPACCLYAMRPVDDHLRQRFDLPDEPLQICVLCRRIEPLEEPHG